MYSTVPYKIRYMIELSSTDLANIKIRTKMNVQVHTQICLTKETFFAYLAYVRSFSQMFTPIMIIQLGRTIEARITFKTLENFQHVVTDALLQFYRQLWIKFHVISL